MPTLEQLQETMRGLFPELLGIRLVEATPERIVAEMATRDDLCTLPRVTHGGAIMALADTLGAYGTALNLPQGAGTTTIESKTNFFASPRFGASLRGESIPLHRGRRTMVWQTRIESEGKLVALVTQTQMVLQAERAPLDVLGALFVGKNAEEQKALLATLEKSGAAVYRTLAKNEADPAKRKELLAAAEREEENASALEAMLR